MEKQNSDGSTIPKKNQPVSEPKQPIPCLGGCGFFGAPHTLNYCSLCFKYIVIFQS